MFVAVTSYVYENVSYCTLQNQTGVYASAELSLDESEVTDLVELVAAGQENYIGFVDSDGTTIQFFADAVDDILVEVSVSDDKGTYGKKIKQADMESIVGNLAAPYLNYIKSLDLVLRP